VDAHDMTTLWERRWPRCPPIADRLRTAYPDRWIRFHSLPDAKRYAENEQEYRELLDRHHAVLEALGAGAEASVVSITAQFGSSGEAVAQVSDIAGVQPGARYWRAIREDGELSGESSWVHLFLGETPMSGLEGMLRLVADDGCRGVMIVPLDLSWIYHPYDGGADVLAPSASDRDVLRNRFSSWLSGLESGM
jgi:hypothetical protein